MRNGNSNRDIPHDAAKAVIDFEDNALARDLSGGCDAHLVILEDALDVTIDARGNRFVVSGPDAAACAHAKKALEGLYQRLQNGQPIGPGDVRAAARGLHGDGPGAGPAIKTPKRVINGRTPNQVRYLKALAEADLTFGVGPAGTGKTYLAVADAVARLQSGAVERIILSRPALEAGERIGFLPGDMKEKVDPYLRPLYDALHDMLPGDLVERRILAGDIEIAPIAFMRGRTLARSAVILDEAQNATPEQMKMFLTRLGDGAHMAITGDPTQTDLPAGQISGLSDALNVLGAVEEVSKVWFEASDVVRHPLVAKIIDAYDRRAKGTTS